MSDARSLLRQQRNARRIQHPHVQYTAPGKLSCTICHEPIKSEALWDNHTRSAGHRQRLLATAAAKGPRGSNDVAQSAATNGSHNAESKKNRPSSDTLSDEALLAQIIGGSGQKRKHDEDDEDVDMDDAADEGDETAPAKRSKPDLGSPTAAPTSSLSSTTTTTTSTAANGSPAQPDSQQSDNKDTDKSSSSNKRRSTGGGGGGTPPGLVRRISGTPSHGVELQIPSRPATPSASATSTPKATPMGRSPLIPQEGQMAGLPSATNKPPPRASFASAASSVGTTTTAGKESITITTTALPSGNEADDDDDWAAFESEVVHAAPAKPTVSTAATAAGYSGDAVIAAAPMTAQQLAEKKEEEERERRRAQVDVDLEDEKEEATRALETEFEEMEELEARVRKLKEKREAIRRGSVPATATNGPLEEISSGAVAAVAAAGELPANGADDEAKAEDEDDDDDDDDEDEEEDDWAGFRFRA